MKKSVWRSKPMSWKVFYPPWVSDAFCCASVLQVGSLRMKQGDQKKIHLGWVFSLTTWLKRLVKKTHDLGGEMLLFSANIPKLLFVFCFSEFALTYLTWTLKGLHTTNKALLNNADGNKQHKPRRAATNSDFSWIFDWLFYQLFWRLID